MLTILERSAIDVGAEEAGPTGDGGIDSRINDLTGGLQSLLAKYDADVAHRIDRAVAPRHAAARTIPIKDRGSVAKGAQIALGLGQPEGDCIDGGNDL
jgi:hypothetical protein